MRRLCLRRDGKTRDNRPQINILEIRRNDVQIRSHCDVPELKILFINKASSPVRIGSNTLFSVQVSQPT